ELTNFGVGPCTYAIVGEEASAARFLQESSRHSFIEGRQRLTFVDVSHTAELIKGAAIAQNSRGHTQGKRSLAEPREARMNEVSDARREGGLCCFLRHDQVRRHQHRSSLIVEQTLPVSEQFEVLDK